MLLETGFWSGIHKGVRAQAVPRSVTVKHVAFKRLAIKCDTVVDGER